MPKSCSTWTTVQFADFNDGTIGGLSTCFGCSGYGCPNVVNRQLSMPSQWNLEVTHVGQVAVMPFHHRDPFDRLIAAQALVERVPVVGRDAAFDPYGVQRIW